MDKRIALVLVSGLFLSGLLMFSAAGCNEQSAVLRPAVSKLIERAQSFKEAGDYPQAVCRLESAADIAPEMFEVQYNLGVLYTMTEAWENAVIHLQKEAEIEPDNANALYTLGNAYDSLSQAYMTAANTKPEEKKDLAPAMQALSPEEAAQKSQEAQAKAIETYRAFLDKAPQNDPARPDVEALLTHQEQQPAAE